MRAGHRLWSADIATPRDAFDVFGESIPAELSAETVRHAGSLISSIRRSWEVTPTLARAEGLARRTEPWWWLERQQWRTSGNPHRY